MIKYYLLLLAGYLIAALMLTYQNQIFIVPAAIVSMLLIDRRAFRPFLKWKFILFIAILVVGTPLILGKKDAQIFNLRYSSSIFQISLVMFYRSIIILGAIKIFTNKISMTQLSTALHKIKLKKFSDALAISMETLPEIKIITQESIGEFRKKEKSKNFIKELFDFFVHLIIKILKFAEVYHDKSIQSKVKT
jgi:ABC-type multidrug transport system fused ATPase/permease subunit